MIKNLAWTGVLLLCGACTVDNSPAICPAETEQVIVTAIHSPNGLGDRGYCDMIFAGIEISKEAHDFWLMTEVPNNLDEAEQLMNEWLDDTTANGKRLLILASSDFEPMVRAQRDRIPDNERNKVLLLESRAEDLPAYTIHLPMYGACYQAGCAATQFPYSDTCAIVCANRLEGPIVDGYRGFTEGFLDSGGQQADTLFLADDNTGYAMADSLYRLCYTLERKYNFVFPLAGGSNQGLLRFTREYPNTFYTAGMDVDQSDYSDRVAFSVVKHVERAVETFLDQWVADRELPRNMSFGLSSGYVEIVASENYRDFIDETLKACKERAIQKENDYEANR